MIPIDFSVPSGLSDSDPTSEREEAICPRCHLHFRPRAEEASNALSARKTVLVVEDMKYFREIARDALGEKYDVRTVESPSEALEAIREGGIDLLVLDLTLDQSAGGVGLLAQLQPKPCPILIFTAEDESEMYGERWEELKKCGADDLVLKGMNVGDSLIKKVGELLGEPWDAEEISVQS
jgi:CheY-like chemotaxis protein